MSRHRSLPVALFAAIVVAGVASFFIMQAEANEEVAADAPAIPTNTEGFAAADVRREAVTKILAGMEATGAPDSARAPFEEELEALGGPDPSVKPLDGPDGEREWAIQAAEYQRMCDEGDDDACAALPEAPATRSDRVSASKGTSEAGDRDRSGYWRADRSCHRGSVGIATRSDGTSRVMNSRSVSAERTRAYTA